MKIRPKFSQTEAFKVNIATCEAAMNWVRKRGGQTSYVENGPDGDYILVTNTQADGLYVNVKPWKAYDGDWIIRTSTGFLVNTPEQFRQNWEEDL